MKKLIFFACSIVLVSCATQQPIVIKEEPKGEYQLFPIDSFFQDKSKEEINFEKRQAHLTCENEKLRVTLPTFDVTNAVTAQVTGGMYNRARDARNTIYDNCMELKGFKKVWVPFN
jgi:hypothetical protein